MPDSIPITTRERALRSGGTSANAVYAMIERALGQRKISGQTVVDLGCGSGALQARLAAFFKDYTGVDAVRYEAYPPAAKFIAADLNAETLPVPPRSADAVVAAETIEHLENPRAFFREIIRIVKPGGWILITTPNQLSFLSLGTLMFKRQFSAFQDVHYPAHITALLECDLLRIAREGGLRDAAIEYSQSGRIVLTPSQYPRLLSRAFPRLCSDNLLLIGRAP